MDFSSFDEFSFMASTDSKRLPQSDNFSFESKKKLHRGISGEYGAWSMTFVVILATKLSSLGTNRAATRFMPKIGVLL